MKKLTVNDTEANQRLDKFLLKYFNKAQKSFVYKMLRKKRIKYNGAKASGCEIIKKGDEIQMFICDETISSLREVDPLSEVSIYFKTLYEDRNILIADKPAGCLSQRDSKGTKNSLIDQVIFYLWEKGEYDPNGQNAFKPALCNRLDRNTSGIVIVGKSVAALQAVGNMLQNDKITKHYLALVKGQVKRSEKLKAFLSKDESSNTAMVSEEQAPHSKPITTIIEPIETNERYSYIDVTLKTGRPHQIRAHLAFTGRPVVGDKKYGHKGTNMTFLRKYGLNHQFLHSYKLYFSDIEGDFSYLNGKEFCSKLPDALSEIIEDVYC